MAEHHDGADGAGEVARAVDGNGNVLRTDGDGLVVLVDEVHLADEGSNVTGRRLVVNLGRGADLLELALVHNDDAVRKRHGLLLIVGYEYDRDAEVALDFFQLLAHLLTDFCIERGERLVEQEQGGLEEQAARDGDTLLLAAGHLVRILLLAAAHGYESEHLLDVCVDLSLGHLAELEAEGEVFVNGHVRPQVVALEHHCGRALLGGQADDGLTIDGDVAARDVEEAADGAQDGGLAAAGGAEEGDDLTFVNIEVDVFDTVAVVVLLGHILDLELDLTFAHGLYILL